jgi:hypothetical protein
MHEGAGGTDRGQSAGSGIAAAIVQQQEALATVRLSSCHRTADFVCAKSARVCAFFKDECPHFIEHNYCRVFILPNPDDPTEVWGFYTISPSLLFRGAATNSDQRRVPKGLPIPMALIGFMGRHDGAPSGLGEALVVDAARRIYRSNDFAAWGLMLDSEGGKENKKLWDWYIAQGFTPANDTGRPTAMYGALKKFLPELQPPKNSK